MSNRTKVLGVVQARSSSSRLPGKVLLPIMGRPMLAQQIDRVRRSKKIDRLVLATSKEPEDDAVASLGKELNLDVFRGSLTDVLDRIYRASISYKPEHVVRLTGDCPLADPAIIDQLIECHICNEGDYTSNCLLPTLPDGLDAEVFTFQALEVAWREAVLPSHREHVTLFLTTHPNRFRLSNMAHSEDLSALRWTVDTPDDFEFVRVIFQSLLPDNPNFSMEDVLALLRAKPELMKLNNRYLRNEGLAKSLRFDLEFQEGQKSSP